MSKRRASFARILLAGLAAWAISIPAAHAAPGDLDTTFGTGGVTVVGSPNGADTLKAIARQADGKIVAVGTAQGAGSIDFAIVRFNADGTLDTGFGTGGKVITAVSSWVDYRAADTANAVAIQPDGKIVVAGSATIASGHNDWALVRYNTDGSLDMGFGIGGKVQFSPSTSTATLYAIALQSDNKIVAAGSSGASLAVGRFNADGTSDSTFATAGVAIVASSAGRAVVIQGNGAIVVAGGSKIARLTSAGALDATFGTSGIATISSASIVAMALQGDGQFVLAGTKSSNSFLTRYTSAGVIDATFGSSGVVTTAIAPSNSDGFTSLTLQSDGSIVAAGYASLSPDNITVARYSAAGVLDPGFGTAGIVTTPSGTNSGTTYTAAVLVLPDAKILVGATATGEGNDFALARFSSAGVPDATFGSGGVSLANIGKGSGYANTAVVQSDGRIVLAGNWAAPSGGVGPMIVRLTSGGSLDATFGSGGIVAFDPGSAGQDVNSAVLQPDGKIVLAGYLGAESFIWRLLPDGSFDPAFGVAGKVTSTFGFDCGDSIASLALQTDGKFVVAGEGYNCADLWYSGFVARLDSTGGLDTSFGTGGVTSLSNASFDVRLTGVTVQTDQKIVAVGYSTDWTLTGSAYNMQLVLARFTSTGSLDGAFGNAGVASLSAPGAATTVGLGVVVQPGGRLVVPGYTTSGVNTTSALFRFTDTGSLDASFGTSGIASSAALRVFTSALMVPVDKIAVAGYDMSRTAFALAVFNANGTLDSGFGSGGIATPLTGNPTTSPYAFIHLPDGNFLLAGQLAQEFAAARVLGGLEAFSLSASSMTFTGRAVGTSSTSQSIQLSNIGPVPMNITSVNVTGDFSQTNDCGTGLGVGGFCYINVTFTPTAMGTRTGTVSVTGPGGTRSATLSGVGITPVAGLSPSALTFPARNVGTGGSALSATLSNTGNGALAIASITASGDFAQTSNCGVSVAAGSSCTIDVTFTPTASGARSGTLTVAHSAAGSPGTVALSGTGNAGVATLTPSSLVFAIQALGVTSASQGVTLSNTGGGTLLVTSISASTEFAQSNNCGAGLGAGGSCTINVTFRPVASGARSGELTVITNDLVSPTETATLSGTGDGAGGLPLTVTRVGPGRIVSSPTGIDCGATCSLSFSGSTPVTLAATPATGSSFTGWTGSCAGTGTCQVTMDAARSVTATFTAPYTADLSVTQSPSPDPAAAGKDVIYTLTVSNAGPDAVSAVTLTDAMPLGTTFIWASPACANASGTVTCNVGALASGASAQVKVVVRTSAAGSITNNANVSALVIDANTGNDYSASTIAVSSTPAGTPIPRYRLYSPVTLEHHFTTDLNEYNVLGGYVGTWNQEGGVGKVLDNPGSFGGVTATPYYRLYNTSTQWHHWTTDANEYYTLITFPWWHGEGVDGYILPSATTGATQLYRLLYPFVPGLHHWTIDANEYSVLTTTYGWIGEGGAGFVVQ